MKKQKPIDFSITTISDPNKAFSRDAVFLSNEFAILYNMADKIRYLLANNHIELSENFSLRLNQPYRIKEVRVLLLIKGQVTIQYNLMEYVIRPSQILVIPIDSIIQINAISPDTILRMIGFGHNFIPFARKDEHADYYWGNKQSLIIPLSEDHLQMVEKSFSLIWETVQLEEFHREIVQHILIALLHLINYIRRGYQLTIDYKLTHQDHIFNRFISLVDKYAVSERSVGFYADRLCLTPRYLNTVIGRTTGQTVMQWINQAVILEAKVLLKHNDLLIYQVSDKLHFANPSFFSKFFKRMTGVTPEEYRRG